MSKHDENQTAGAESTEATKGGRKKRRNALTVYLTVMFAVAFLLILVSFLIQMRNSNETITQLNENTANAQTNIQSLEEQNEGLQTEKESLQQQIEDLQQELETVQQENSVLQQDLDEVSEELTELEESLIAAETDRETLSADLESTQAAQDQTALQLENTQRAYALLMQAENAYESGDYETASACLQTIEDESLTAYLDDAGAVFYASLPEKIEQAQIPTTDSVTDSVDTENTENMETAEPEA